MPRKRRLSREEPARTGPLRNPVARQIPSMPDTGAVVSEGLQTARRVVEATSASMKGAVERGVETAYMVIEEYMSRGREAAMNRINGDRPMSEKDPYGSAGPWMDPWAAMAPMMAPWIQMMRMWADTMSRMGWPGSAWPNPVAPGGPGARPGGSAVSVQVTSTRPARVTVALTPGSEGLPLTASPLEYAGAGDAEPLENVVVETLPGDVRVSLTVPDAQPAGRYAAGLHDASGFRRGELTVEIEDVKKRARRRKKPSA